MSKVATESTVSPQNVIKFWFKDIKPAQWWVKDDKFDQLITDKFLDVHKMANKCELFSWRESPHGRLAEIIVLDQFSRNMFRGRARSFSSDSLALALSQEAIFVGADQKLSVIERSFLYMPFMHSESSAIHKIALSLFKTKGMESNLSSEVRHKKIIDQFGRYPHRNDILQRTSTPAEIDFLKQANSRF